MLYSYHVKNVLICVHIFKSYVKYIGKCQNLAAILDFGIKEYLNTNILILIPHA